MSATHRSSKSIPMLCLVMRKRQRSSVLIHCIATLVGVVAGLVRFLPCLFRSRPALIAENLFLRKQLAFYREREIEPHRLTDAGRVCLVVWARLFNWREALVIVKPETLVGWHRKGFRLFWRWKSKGGRPRLPRNIRQLIADMAAENPTWGEERIADELALKLGIYVSPRTVRTYWPEEPLGSGHRSTRPQHWRSFVRNHAQAIVACDFLVAVTARFQLLYILVVMEICSRRILHFNVTAHPTSSWTTQQLREAIPSDHQYRFLIHDRDSIFSAALDQQVGALGLRVLRTPVRAPKANAYCERLVGTIRRECLDYLIPLNERHLRNLLREWVRHYNQARPHSALGPGIPEASDRFFSPKGRGHVLPSEVRIHKEPVLGGLHHEYILEKLAS
jgi:putative transposase